jgi:hypothetical protein
MNRVVVFTESVSAELIAGAFPQVESLVVGSKSECANALVGEAAIDCLVVQRDVYGPEYQSFLSSIKRHFPVLEVILIAPDGPTPPPDGCHFIGDSIQDAELVGRITALAQAARASDQRHGIRYDWPLRGHLQFDNWETPCKVRSFSSSGAFLEMGEAFQTGATHETAAAPILRVEFLNSHITVKCELVRQAEADRGESAGHGVRFLDFPSQAHEFCERIVCDAVLQALLHPEEEQSVPTLTDEDLTIPGFDRL